MSRVKSTDKAEWLTAHGIRRKFGLAVSTINSLVVHGRVRMQSRPMPLSEQRRPRITYSVADVRRYMKERGKIMK